MPLIESTFTAPPLLANSHLQTILPNFFRKVKDIEYIRERVITYDSDFLDLDYVLNDSSSLAIISHGMEGSSNGQYVLGMARYFSQRGWDILAWNYRGCSGELNQLGRFYHSGETTDLDFVINHALSTKSYKRVALIGFSLGGNITLKYLGEMGANAMPEIIGAVTFSTPCHLATGAKVLNLGKNKLYQTNFLMTLKVKLFQKYRKGLAKNIDIKKALLCRSLEEYDNVVTAPLHGFKGALDYYEQSSSINYLADIKVPSLLVNAKDDPIISKESFPIELAKQSEHFYLETPPNGGHVGFSRVNLKRDLWSEKRAWQFISAHGLKREN